MSVACPCVSLPTKAMLPSEWRVFTEGKGGKCRKCTITNESYGVLKLVLFQVINTSENINTPV